jgi:hypothetical protein
VIRSTSVGHDAIEHDDPWHDEPGMCHPMVDAVLTGLHFDNVSAPSLSFLETNGA